MEASTAEPIILLLSLSVPGFDKNARALDGRGWGIEVDPSKTVRSSRIS